MTSPLETACTRGECSERATVKELFPKDVDGDHLSEAKEMPTPSFVRACDGRPTAWVKCDTCLRWWHARCAGYDALNMTNMFSCIDCTTEILGSEHDGILVYPPQLSTTGLTQQNGQFKSDGIVSSPPLRNYQQSQVEQQSGVFGKISQDTIDVKNVVCGARLGASERASPVQRAFPDSTHNGGLAFRTPNTFRGTQTALRKLWFGEEDNDNSPLALTCTSTGNSPKFASPHGSVLRLQTTPRRSRRALLLDGGPSSVRHSPRLRDKTDENKSRLAPLNPTMATPTLLRTPSGLPGEHGTDIIKNHGFKVVAGAGGRGKLGVVFIVTTPHGGNQLAVKRQLVQNPRCLDDTAHRELLIAQELARVHAERGCQNWMVLIDWYKIRAPLYPAPSGGARSPFPLAEDLYLHYVMEKADFRLSDRKNFSVSEYRSIIFQVLFGLAVLQEELEFMHNDLHADNILLKFLPVGERVVCEWHSSTQREAKSSPLCSENDSDIHDITGKQHRWYIYGFVAKICDYGLARITLRDGRRVWNPNDKSTEVFNHTRDLNSLAYVMRALSTFVDWQGRVADRKEHGKLQRTMADVAAPLAKFLIHHSFFDALKTPPEAIDDVQTLPAGKENCCISQETGMLGAKTVPINNRATCGETNSGHQ